MEDKIKLTLTPEHREKAIAACENHRNAVINSCIIAQALKEKYNHISPKAIAVYTRDTVIDGNLYTLDDEAFCITSLLPSQWNDISLPVDIELTKWENEK